MVSVPIPNQGDTSQAGKKQYDRSSTSQNREPKFEAQSDLVPPQNLEAEEAVLGGILLDPDAISRVAWA